MREYSRILTLMGLQAFSLGMIALATLPSAFDFHALDLLIYHESSLAALRGQWPSVDEQMVYPPLALIPFSLPHLMAFLTGHTLDLGAYARLWPLLNIGLSIIVSILLIRFSPPATSPLSGNRLFLYTIFAVLSGPILLWRYDLFPTLLTLGAALALKRGRPFIAGLCLGAGVAAKLYPALLLPIFILYSWTQGKREHIPRLLLGTMIAALIPFLPFAIFQPRLLLSLLAYHSQRGLEIESLYAGWIALLHHLGLAEARPTLQYGTWDIASPVADWFIRWQPLFFAIAYTGCLWDGWRKFRKAQADPEIGANLLMVSLLEGLLTFILTSKVFSPQYILWILPFGTFLNRKHLPVLLSAILLTTVNFPFLFNNLTRLEWGPVLILNLRNALTGILLVGLMVSRKSTL